MKEIDIEPLKQRQRRVEEALERCVLFRLNNAVDRVNGGIYTRLDAEGNVCPQSKSVCAQGRCAWAFSYLCQSYGIRRDWLNTARSCLDFLEEHCIDRDFGGCMYFTVSAAGEPLERRHCFLSEVYYALANAEYAALTGEDERMRRARDKYAHIWDENRGLIDAHYKPRKRCDERRLSILTRLLSLSMAMRRCDPDNAALYNERTRICAGLLASSSAEPHTGGDGGLSASPGRETECASLLLELSRETDDAKLARIALDVLNRVMRMEQSGGTDDRQCPFNGAALIASLVAYRYTGGEQYRDWFIRTFDRCGCIFDGSADSEQPDERDSENAASEPPAASSAVIGSFHMIGMLIIIDRLLEGLLSR